MEIKVANDRSSDLIVILADDGYNPIRIPLTLEDAEKLNKNLNQCIERIKDENRNFRP